MRNISESIDAYEPRPTLDVWPVICEWVRLVVLDSDPQTAGSARTRMTTVKRFAAWGVRNHFPLERETLFTPDRIEHYILTEAAGLSDSGRASQRAQLSSIGRAVTRRAPWPPMRTRFPARRMAEPYSPAQADRIWDAAPQQISDYRRRIAMTAVSLGLGAGIAAREYAAITGGSIEPTPYGVFVHVVGVKWPRVIPVVGVAAKTLLHLAEGREELPLIADRVPTHRNASNSLMSRVEMPRSVGHLNASRLRMTWLVTMLAQLPLRVVVDLYGPRTTDLSELLDYLTPLPLNDIAQILTRNAR